MLTQAARIYWNVIMKLSRALVLRPNSDGEGTPDVVHLGAVDDAIRLEARPPASVEREGVVGIVNCYYDKALY